MSRFYCPFCSSRYQFYKTRADGVLICGQCGDPLEKKVLLKPRQFFGLIAVLAFVTPLLIMVIVLIRDFPIKNIPEQSDSIVLISI